MYWSWTALPISSDEVRGASFLGGVIFIWDTSAFFSFFLAPIFFSTANCCGLNNSSSSFCSYAIYSLLILIIVFKFSSPIAWSSTPNFDIFSLIFWGISGLFSFDFNSIFWATGNPFFDSVFWSLYANKLFFLGFMGCCSLTPEGSLESWVPQKMTSLVVFWEGGSGLLTKGVSSFSGSLFCLIILTQGCSLREKRSCMKSEGRSWPRDL